MNSSEDNNVNKLLSNISNNMNNNLNLPLMNDNIILNPLTGLLELNPTTLTPNNLINNMNLVNPLLSQWIHLQQQQQQSLMLLNALQQQPDLNLLNTNLNQSAFLNGFSTTQFPNSSLQSITLDNSNKLNDLNNSVLQPITSFDNSPQEVPLMSLLPAQVDGGINNLFKEEEEKEERPNIDLLNQIINLEVIEKQSGKIKKVMKDKNHNVIEKKYRSSLLDGIESLKDSLPFIIDEQGKIVSFIQPIKPPKKFSKSTILNKAKEYIEYLKLENENLRKENNTLKGLNNINCQISHPLSSLNSNSSSSPEHNGVKNTRFYIYSFVLTLLFYLPFYHPITTNTNERVISLSSFPFISIMFLFSLFIITINSNILNNYNNNNGKQQLQLSLEVTMLDAVNSIVKLISTAFAKWTKNDVFTFNHDVSVKDAKLLCNLKKDVSKSLFKWMVYVYNACIIVTKLFNTKDYISKMELTMISIILNSQFNLNTENLINYNKKGVKLLQYFERNYKSMDFNSNFSLYQYVMDQFNLYQLNEVVLIKDKQHIQLLISKINNDNILPSDTDSMKICQLLNKIYNNETINDINSIPKYKNHINLEYFLKHNYLISLLNQKDNEKAKHMILEVRYLIQGLDLHKEDKVKLTSFYHSMFISLN